MNPAPKITVVMPVYNSEKYLRDTIKSVLCQTFGDFEFLIINDGSTDKSLEIIKSFSDSRIRIVNREKNIGLQKNLFDGVGMAKGEYIARMDSDDICLPYRFSEQIKFMDSHSEIGICGSWYKTIGAESFVHKPPVRSEDIKANMLFYTSLAHPSVMMRTELLKKFNLNYNQEIPYCEDYDLWWRSVQCFPIANIPKVLLFYRIHPESIFQANRQAVRDVGYRLRAGMLKKIGIEQSEEEKRLHNFLKPAENESLSDYLDKEEAWLLKILDANKKQAAYKTESLNKVIYERWLSVCAMNKKNGLPVLKRCRASVLFTIGGKKKYPDLIKMLIKYFLKK